jgi:hypothetical protein
MCTSAFASPSCAADPVGLDALAGMSPVQAVRDRTALELSDSNAIEHWSLRAGAYRGAWDATEASAVPRFDWRSAVTGEVARGSLAFDWQRRLADGNISGGGFARLSRTDVSDGASGLASLEQRQHESAFGAALQWSGGASFAGLPASNAFSASFRNNGRDASAGIVDQREDFRDFRRDRLDESVTSLAASTEVGLPGRIRLQAGTRLDVYRANVQSDVLDRAGSVAAQVISPYLRLRAPALGGEAFLTLGRGVDSSRATALIDPRSGAAAARLDPAASMDTIEIGFRRRLPLGIETTVSMFRARADEQIVFTGENAITEFSRPLLRQGVQLAARTDPLPWLTLDFEAASMRARYADGGAEFVPGAAGRSASAAATIHAGGDWTASLMASYLGRRTGLDETTNLASSIFMNARLTRNLSKNTRIALDALNLLDQRLADVDYFSASRLSGANGMDGHLFTPAEPRGIRLQLRTTF